MKTRLSPVFVRTLVAALMTFGAAWAPAARAETVEHIDKTFPAKSGGTLVVEIDQGAIEVTTGQGMEVAVQVERKVKSRDGDKSAEEAFLQDRPVSLRESDGGLAVECQGGGQNAGAKGTSVQARYRFTLPAEFNVQLKTKTGAIWIRDLKGKVEAQTKGGALAFAQLKGSVEGETAGGEIRLTACDGELRVKSRGGPIEAEGGRGTLEGATAGGPIAVKDFRGSVRVETSGGPIRLDGIAGRVQGTTSGGPITANLSELTDDVSLSTSAGGVTLRAPENAAFDVEASTKAGKVQSDWPLESSDGTDGQRPRVGEKLTGSVNGGGKKVILRSGAGGIQLRKR
jgi:hypothetical protein